ncbi:MAG TPA: hypothetical protein GXX17_06005 [Clostridiales bacterium]|nr:hypothetical protein [Clostridiales bacterium]
MDTNRDDNDIAPFKNILNDMYAKDLSRKVKSAKRQRAYSGYYIIRSRHMVTKSIQPTKIN